MGKISKKKRKAHSDSSPKKTSVSPVKKVNWRPLVIIILITCAAYYPALKADFIWDDDFYVTENPLLTAPDGLRRIWFTTESPSQYFPLTYTIFLIERGLWNLDPLGYHLVNIVLHVINALLVFMLFTRLGLRGAWMIAAIFALHPVHVESVAWVTELKNVLSGMLCLLSLLFYLRFEDDQQWTWYTGSLVLFVLALLSKTVVLTLPAVLLVIRWWRKRSITLRDINLLIPFIVIGVGMGLLSWWWEVNHQGTTGEIFEFSMLQRLLLSGRAVWFYVMKLLWPMNLTFSYPQWNLDPREIIQYGWHIGLIVVGLLLWYMRDRWGRGPLTGVTVFIITLSPMLGFINYYTMRYSFVADHYQYLASLGLIAVFVEGVQWGFRRWRDTAGELTLRRAAVVEKGVGFAVLVILGILTWHQTHIYRDSETLWQDTLRKNPRSWMAYNNLGVFVTKRGQLDQGIEYFKHALESNPEHLEAHNNLGGAYTKEGRFNEAIAAYEQALVFKPDHPKTHNNLGSAYASLDRLDDAIAEYEKALSHSPRYVEAHYNLGNAYTKYGKFDEAITAYKQALAIKPLHAEALTNLGVAYLNSDRVDEAVIQFQKALAIKPGLLNALTNLAYAYYLLGNYQLAAFECERIKKLGYRVPPQLLEMLKPHLSKEN